MRFTANYNEPGYMTIRVYIVKYDEHKDDWCWICPVGDDIISIVHTDQLWEFEIEDEE